MNIKKIHFTNYKKFEKEQTLELKPLTILIGKNSAGKSSLLKLPLLIFNSFKHINSNSLVNFKYKNLDLGYEYKDLLYNKYETRVLRLGLEMEVDSEPIIWSIGIQNFPEENEQIVLDFSFKWKDIDLCLNLDLESKSNYTGELNSQPIINSRFLFDGLFPYIYLGEDKVIKKVILKIQSEFKSLFRSIIYKCRYLLPFRAFPKRLYDSLHRDSPFYDFSGQDIPYYLLVNTDLLKDVEKWYHEHLDIEKIETNKIDRAGRFFEINIFHKGFSNTPVNLVDVGQGISQSLPIVSRALMDRGDSIDILEQPELHLHPAAHGDIASLLVSSALKNPNSKYIIETHSENFILRIRRLIVEGVIPNDWVNIYWVENNSENNNASLSKINIDDEGEVDFWPEGVFSEAFVEAKAIRRAQREKKDN